MFLERRNADLREIARVSPANRKYSGYFWKASALVSVDSDSPRGSCLKYRNNSPMEIAAVKYVHGAATWH
jgi:hypothetical protein